MVKEKITLKEPMAEELNQDKTQNGKNSGIITLPIIFIVY